MTQFDIAYTDFKREDTTNDITITLYADNKRPITPNSSHTWKAKVAKGDKYVGEYPVAILGNTLKLSSSNLTRLPDGNYSLELWETYDGSTASPGSKASVTQSIANGENQLTFNIPQGEQGEQGDVGPAPTRLTWGFHKGYKAIQVMTVIRRLRVPITGLMPIRKPS